METDNFTILHGHAPDRLSGAGTTAAVALSLGRKFVGIELDPKSVGMTKKRIQNLQINFFK